MTGKITFKAGTHSSRAGGWVVPVTLCRDDVSALTVILERSLTVAECQMLARMLTDIRAIREATAGDAVKHQEIIETLKAIYKADDDGVQQAFKDCDDTTESLIQDQICVMGVWVLTWHTPDRIRAAAKLALCDLGSGKNGPRTKGYRILFAQAVLCLWEKLGHTNKKIWAADDQASGTTASPLVHFAQRLLKIIEPKTCPSLSTVAKLLRKVSA